jgi:hypothetical protein
MLRARAPLTHDPSPRRRWRHLARSAPARPGTCTVDVGVTLDSSRGGTAARLTPLRASPLLLLAALGLAACGTRAREDGAATVAGRFVASVSGHDGASACRLLTDPARESVSGATDVACAAAVLNVQERGTAVGKVEVWGDAAQVRIGTDVIFLVHLRAGWFVSAAGCTPRPGAPYKCDVDG